VKNLRKSHVLDWSLLICHSCLIQGFFCFLWLEWLLFTKCGCAALCTALSVFAIKCFLKECTWKHGMCNRGKLLYDLLRAWVVLRTSNFSFVLDTLPIFHMFWCSLLSRALLWKLHWCFAIWIIIVVCDAASCSGNSLDCQFCIFTNTLLLNVIMLSSSSLSWGLPMSPPG